MDYETIEINCNKACKCHIDQNLDLGWEKGELAELRIPIFGYIEVGGLNISTSDFLIGSNTKSIRMVLKNLWDEEIDIQEMPASQLDFEGDTAIAYFVVDEHLTNRANPGSYNLFAYLVNKIPPVTEAFEEKTLMNMLLTCPEGLEVTVY